MLPFLRTEPRSGLHAPHHCRWHHALTCRPLAAAALRPPQEKAEAMLHREDEVDTEVRLVDQNKINEFGRNNDMLAEMQDVSPPRPPPSSHHLGDRACADTVRCPRLPPQDMDVMNEELEKLDDASTELMMQDGDNVRLQIAECFVSVTEEFCGEYLEREMEKKQAEVDAFKAKMDVIRKRQMVRAARAALRAASCARAIARRRRRRRRLLLLLPAAAAAAAAAAALLLPATASASAAAAARPPPPPPHHRASTRFSRCLSGELTPPPPARSRSR
jgi:hypothetical protein